MRLSGVSKPISNKEPTIVADGTVRGAVETLLIVLGSTTVILLVVVALATAITKSTWWYRRRRSYVRRLELTGRSENITFEDKCFHYVSYILESLAFTSGNTDDTTRTNYVRPKFEVKSSLREDPHQIGLPLRFQPEKLYGAVSTVHRENLRKKSWTTLGLQPSPATSRRASMVDSLLHLAASATTQSKTKRDAKIGSSSISVEPGKLWRTEEIPQIDVTCVNNESEIEATGESNENLLSENCFTALDQLAVTLPARRASSTNFELLTTKHERKLSLQGSKIHNSTKSIQSDQESTEDGQPLRRKRRSFSHLIKEKRPSLSEVTRRCSSSWSTASAFQSAKKRIKDSDANSTDFDSDDVTKHQVKLPGSPPIIEDSDSAGLLAVCLNSNGQSSNLYIKILSIKSIKSQRPWHRITYTLRCLYKNDGGQQQATLRFKNTEYKLSELGKSAEVKFERNSPVGSKEELQIRVFECGSKWSGEKSYYHGIVTIPMLADSMNISNWYKISSVYPMIRLRADALVSLCQRPLEGLLSIGVHEIRNVEFNISGQWEMEALANELKNLPIEIAVHACLVHDGHMSKSRKSIFLQRSGYRPFGSSKDSTTVGATNETNPNKSDVPVNRLVGGEHYLQFSLPELKKSFGKLPLSDYGIIIFFSNKVQIADRLPADCVANLRSSGIHEARQLNAIGECFIGDEGAQIEYRKDRGLAPKFDMQSSSLWSEVNSHGSSRVYQWLSVE